MARFLIVLGLAVAATAQSDGIPIAPQSNTFNSSFSLSNEQIASAGLNSTVAHNFNIAARFEQTNWATGSVDRDPFYDAPSGCEEKAPGSLLKVEEVTNTSLYTLPPNVALSRILFNSESFNGSAVPASAYVLWPWMPRLDPKTGKYAVVSWGHGTSGVFGECAPSHIRNLWYQYSAPYTLALQGYVVVAADYTGLGVNRFPNGTEIAHPYLNNIVAANDLIYAVQAAQKAFPEELSSRFVTMGHSEGGGAAWGTAQRQAKTPVDGYLGTVAGSPVTNTIDQINKAIVNPELPFNIGQGLNQTLADFDLSEFLTDNGLRYARLYHDIQGCNSVTQQFALIEGLIRPDWLQTPAMQQLVHLTGNGGRPISGPMLVVQGTADGGVPVQVTDKYVDATCGMFPQSPIQYARFEGADHVPVLYASQRVWLDWIWERFAGQAVAKGCSRKTYSPAREVGSYQKELTFYLEIATQPYEVA